MDSNTATRPVLWHWRHCFGAIVHCHHRRRHWLCQRRLIAIESIIVGVFWLECRRLSGWLVAVLGFLKIRLDAAALPLIGLGMLCKLTGPRNSPRGTRRCCGGFWDFISRYWFFTASLCDRWPQPRSKSIIGLWLLVGVGVYVGRDCADGGHASLDAVLAIGVDLG